MSSNCHEHIVPRIVLYDILNNTNMKGSDKKNNSNKYISDDDNIKYKLNTKHFPHLLNNKTVKKDCGDSEDEILYKFPKKTSEPKVVKPKQKIKVNFWSNKQNSNRLHRSTNGETSRRHTVAVNAQDSTSKQKIVKLRKKVLFLATPQFSENHVPMVTVPDDLTINLNEEEANDLQEDLNSSAPPSTSRKKTVKFADLDRNSQTTTTQTSPRGTKRKNKSDNNVYDSEFDFFSKYIVQKLRKMELNQRIYAENLINSVLMLGQLNQLSVRHKVGDT